MLVLLVSPPRSLGSPPGNDRRDLLPNILQGRIQLLRGHAHHLLTQKLISMGNSAANHVIGVRGASRLVPLPLLCLLAQNVGKILTHKYITQKIWGIGWENNIASLRVFMATLRKKLETSQDSPTYIQTQIGVGYRMLKL